MCAKNMIWLLCLSSMYGMYALPDLKKHMSVDMNKTDQSLVQRDTLGKQDADSQVEWLKSHESMGNDQLATLDSQIMNIAFNKKNRVIKWDELDVDAQGKINTQPFYQALHQAVSDIEKLQSLRSMLQKISESEQKKSLDAQLNLVGAMVAHDIAEIIYAQPYNVDLSKELTGLSSEVKDQVNTFVSLKKQQDVNALDTIEKFQTEDWSQEQLDTYMTQHKLNDIVKQRIQARFDFWQDHGIKPKNIDEKMDEYKSKLSERALKGS